jgi:hypothetical protein
MVTPQATQPPQAATGDSARITAEVRRQILREHYTERLARQQAVVASERADREANGVGAPMFSRADVAVSNTIAVLQDISSTLAAYSDNRDFREVQR